MTDFCASSSECGTSHFPTLRGPHAHNAPLTGKIEMDHRFEVFEVGKFIKPPPPAPFDIELAAEDRTRLDRIIGLLERLVGLREFSS